MEWPYITPALPGVGGTLRADPSHFVVEEIPLYAPSGEGQHLYVNLSKVGLTTKEVQRQLARLFALREADVGFAGMKDKHARTTQTFSLGVGHQNQAYVVDAAKRIEDALPVTVHWTALHKNKLRPGHLLGNRFRIVIADLALPVDEGLAAATTIAEQLATLGLPNYFGPQRFGVGQANVRKGLAVLKGETYVRDRWLRRFLVSAYQSYLCNQYLARRVETGCFNQLLLGDVAKKHDTGGMFDVTDLAAEQPRFLSHEISYTAPLFGTKMRAASGEAGTLEESILAESPIDVQAFSKAKVEGTRRMGRLLIPDLAVTAAQDAGSSALEVTFTLPKGAFATTVLREIMKADVTNLPDETEDE